MGKIAAIIVFLLSIAFVVPDFIGSTGNIETEMEFWISVEKHPSEQMYRLYLEKYPNGEFKDIALKAIEDIAAENALKEQQAKAKRDAEAEAKRIAAQNAEAEAKRVAAQNAENEAKRVAAQNAENEAKRVAAQNVENEAKRLAAQNVENEAKRNAKRVAAQNAKNEAQRNAKSVAAQNVKERRQMATQDVEGGGERQASVNRIGIVVQNVSQTPQLPSPDPTTHNRLRNNWLKE
jgi:membrane protein involved in colicin uptake